MYALTPRFSVDDVKHRVAEPLRSAFSKRVNQCETRTRTASGLGQSADGYLWNLDLIKALVGDEKWVRNSFTLY